MSYYLPPNILRFAMIIRALCAATLILSVTPSFATTWNEPWQRTIVQRSTTLGLYEVKSVDGSTAVLTRKKHLAGEETPREITTTGYTLLHLTSSSSEGNPVWIGVGEQFYFFLEKDGPASWKLPTPSSGSDYRKSDSAVHATYAISMQKALIDAATYELTQTCIFNVAHQQRCDRGPIDAFIKKNLALPPVAMGEKTPPDEAKRFFAQHAALETATAIGYKVAAADIDQFINSPSVFQQMSGLRYRAVNQSERGQFSFAAFVCDTTKVPLARQYALLLMTDYDMRNEASALKKCVPGLKATDGGQSLVNIMDQRVGTRFPDHLKDEAMLLLKKWGPN